MSIKLEVDPKTVWGFYPSTAVSKDFIEYLDRCGWNNVPRIPIFRIPDLTELVREHNYFLLDGNQRLNAAILREERLPAMLYEPEEPIDQTRDGLAFSKNLNNPRRFQVLMLMYQRRNWPNRGMPVRAQPL